MPDNVTLLSDVVYLVCEPPFLWAAVQPNMLNMSKSPSGRAGLILRWVIVGVMFTSSPGQLCLAIPQWST